MTHSIPKLKPKFIDWVLYNLPLMREYIDSLEPKTSASIVSFDGSGGKLPSSPVEKIAIKRATASQVLDVVERAIKTLHPEQRKVYRMRYRAHMTYKQISRRLYISEETVGRRLAEIRAVVGQYLQQVSPSDLAEFVRFFEYGS